MKHLPNVVGFSALALILGGFLYLIIHLEDTRDACSNTCGIYKSLHIRDGCYCKTEHGWRREASE